MVLWREGKFRRKQADNVRVEKIANLLNGYNWKTEEISKIQERISERFITCNIIKYSLTQGIKDIYFNLYYELSFLLGSSKITINT